MPAAPTILSVTLSASEVTVGDAVTVAVVWTGDPQATPTFQWRDGSTIIEGATAGTFAPSEAYEALNCLVAVDNGEGSAISITVPISVAEIPTDPPIDPDPGPDPDPDPDPEDGDFSDDFLSTDFDGGV